MGAVGTALKAVFTVIILGGLFGAYYFVGASFDIGPFFGIQGYVFWIALVISVLVFIWGIIPRWLVLLSWTILVVYLTFLVNGAPNDIQVYLALVLFGLFLIFLAKWIRDVRRVRRLLQGLDSETLVRVQKTVQAARPSTFPLGIPEGSEGTKEPAESAPQDEGAFARNLPLDVQTVKLIRDL